MFITLHFRSGFSYEKYSADSSCSAMGVRRDIIKSNQTDYFIVRLKVDQRAGQLSLPHWIEAYSSYVNLEPGIFLDKFLSQFSLDVYTPSLSKWTIGAIFSLKRPIKKPCEACVMKRRTAKRLESWVRQKRLIDTLCTSPFLFRACTRPATWASSETATSTHTQTMTIYDHRHLLNIHLIKRNKSHIVSQPISNRSLAGDKLHLCNLWSMASVCCYFYANKFQHSPTSKAAFSRGAILTNLNFTKQEAKSAGINWGDNPAVRLCH